MPTRLCFRDCAASGPVTPDPTLLHNLVRAFSNDPFYQRLLSTQPEFDIALAEYFKICFAESWAAGRVDVTADQVSGAALWNGCAEVAVREAAFAQRRQEIGNSLGTATLDLFDSMVAEMDAQTAPLLPDGCWYLSILGVSEQARGQGHGRALINRGAEAAKEAGVFTFLETFKPATLPLYQRCGFSILGRGHVALMDQDFWVLGR